MGGSVSTFVNKHKTMTLDEVAGEYILNMSANHLKLLNDCGQCNKLITEISKILQNTFTETDVKQVSDRIHHNDADQYIGVAKFYVKIAHIFASILKTQPTKKGDDTSLCGSRLFALINNPSKKIKQDKGMPELDTLYNDAKYDFESGEFKGRSEKMEKLYQSNLTSFYKAFTGSDIMNPKVTTFADIKLNSYRCI